MTIEHIAGYDIDMSKVVDSTLVVDPVQETHQSYQVVTEDAYITFDNRIFPRADFIALWKKSKGEE